jgi:hypothetical protein
MHIIIHRVNKIADLATISKKYGVEIDVRGYGDKILLNHEPIDDPKKYDELEEYLKNFKHAFIVFNVKEAGYEERIIALAKKYGIKKYFLLDVEFPYLYRATRKEHFRKIAVRYSEAEPIENVLAQCQNGKPLVDWVWIDTNTILPLTKKITGKLTDFQTCLVCPDRWGRPEDIAAYAEKIKKMNFHPDAVMTALPYAETWENGLSVKKR